MWNVCCQTPWQLYSGEFGFQFKYVQISGYPTGSFKNSAHHNPPCRLAPKNTESCQSNSLCYQMSHKHTDRKKMFGTTAQRIATNIHSRWILLELTLTQQRNPSSSRSLRLHRSPHLFSDGRIVVALRILRPRGITDNCHGRTPWSSLGHCWNRFRRFNLATNLPSDLWETPKQKKYVVNHGCHGLCSVGKTRWDLPSLQGAAASPRVRSIFEPVPGAVCDREKSQLKTTAPNAQDSIVSNPPQRSKKSDDVWWTFMGKMKARTVACDVSGHVC